MRNKLSDHRGCMIETKGKIGMLCRGERWAGYSTSMFLKKMRGWIGVDTSIISRIGEVEGVIERTKESTNIGLKIRKALTEWKEGG